MQSITYTQNLSGDGWEIQDESGKHALSFSVPGDVHSTLLDNGAIVDPYWRDTEVSLDWVHQTGWTARKSFDFAGDLTKRHFLSLDSVDCVAKVFLNDVLLGSCNSQFIRWEFDVSSALLSGRNELHVEFLSNSTEAEQRANASEIDVPYLSFNNRLPHYNFLRKTQCHAGWDWNIALSPIGIYGDVVLREANSVKFDDLMVRQNHLENGDVELEVEAFFTGFEVGTTTFQVNLCGVETILDVDFYPVDGRAVAHVTIPKPELWWPVGHGGQMLHNLEVSLGEQTITRKIGFRKIEIDTSKDEVGNRFVFLVNGREIFAKGANWIPADALPAKGTPELVRDRLQSAVDANMNMIRVWGGGQYEADWFYDLCSELGILVWQDFMFACNLYPAHDRQWLNSAKKEADQQIKRLSSHACMALWCGDNELVGALNWYPQSKANRDRYLVIYDRLNHVLEQAIDELRPDIAFWPSSPTAGRLDYADAWHSDTSGDMHFWDVWHSAKDFEHYRTVKPRFCSEFGFQSFPSMQVIESFTEPQDRNVSSKVMDVHQRNDGGNSRIVETISRYFRFPDSFEDMVYLSQISQGLAMQTSIEFWRAQSPRCMGTLYWQLNDTWPVASWSSLEYGGNWKLTHYLAKRFFAPVLVTAQPSADEKEIEIIAIADAGAGGKLTVIVEQVSLGGDIATLGDFECKTGENAGTIVTSIKKSDIPDDCFLHFTWFDAENNHLGTNDFLPKRPKAYDFGEPNIVATRNAETGEVVLTSDKPALYVTYDHGGDDIYSDNCFTLLPGRPKRIKTIRKRSAHMNDVQGTVQYLKS